MFITKEESQRRLQSSKNLVNIISSSDAVASNSFDASDKESGVANLGGGSLPTSSAAKIIGLSLVKQGVSKETVCKELNIQKNDLEDPSKSEEKKISESIQRIRELALDKMMIALGLMTAEKFENATLKDLTSATANLSKVIAQTSEGDINIDHSKVMFVVHSPEARKISEYKVVDV